MFNYRGTVQLRRKCGVFSARGLSAQVAAAQEAARSDDPVKPGTTAQPYQSMPGPTKLQLIRGFLPGGNYHGKSLVEMNVQFRKDYGDIFRLPGTFGKRDVIYTFNPEDYKTVFRTEGQYPIRRGFDVLHYYRKVHRPDVFEHAAGLVAEQGEKWARFRSTVNPVMMNTKTTKFYAPRMNTVSDEFLERIRRIRDPQTHEVPETFEKDINHWTMESTGLVALDAKLGMINNSANNPEFKMYMAGMREFLELMFQLDFKPSLWKYISTPMFRQVIKTLDGMTDLMTVYIDKAVERMQIAERQRMADNLPERDIADKSILERLLNTDRKVAIVMALDILLAGVEVTSSAFTGCMLCLAKNPEKQQKLREEVLRILPNKDSPITAEKMLHLPYLRACIKESFRIYPVNTVNFRSTGQDVVLSGYAVPKDIDIAMPLQQLMQDTKYYLEPEKFLPERWLRGDDNAKDDNGCPMNRNVPFVFLPFGFGARVCIGKRIVELELEVTLSKLVRNFDIRFDYPVENIFRTNVVNVPAKPLKFKFIELAE